MIYRITTQTGERYIVTSRDLARAKWDEIGEQEPREITTEAEVYGSRLGSGRLCLFAHSDTGDWTGYETDALRVRDAQGKTQIIPFSATAIWSEEGRTEFFVGNTPARVCVADWYDIPTTALELLAQAGLSISAPDIDYIGIAEGFIAANPDLQFFLDSERGFANEWTLIVSTRPPEDAQEYCQLSPAEAVKYLADSVMSQQDYRDTYASDPYVGAVWCE